MPLSGEYEPSPSDWVRDHADKIIESGDTAGMDMKGKPIILLTTIGAKSGKVRKTPLMRVEHGGVVGARGRGVSGLRGVPDQDRPADPGVRAEPGQLNRFQPVAHEVAPLTGVR